MEVVKPGNKISTGYHNFGAVASVPYTIVGTPDSPYWSFLDRQCAFGLQNLSGGWVSIASSKTDTDGIRIPDNIMLTFDFGDSWDGSLYAVNYDSAVTEIKFAIIFMAI